MSEAATNPRFDRYCLAVGLTHSQARLEIWKFTLWIREQWTDWRAQRAIKDRWYMASTADHLDFDNWLARRAIAQ